MKNIEILAPVGSFESLISAVQNGANAVYFGAKNFNARDYADNFDDTTLKKAIEYAKMRNVKTYLTLNTLIKNNELTQALDLVNTAYSFGIDAIIIQDLGLAKLIRKYFPDIDLHASTQMTVHNLDGVRELEKLGFTRAVLSRELTIDEIKYICQNTKMEIECFVHGALCISYSGQCLISSFIGQRSGNRGRCAGACRLPYKLYNKNEFVKEGYLLSLKDLCTINHIDELINSGITSFKIEGRMKQPEYVGLVTFLYSKAIKGEKITEKDLNNLKQIFNRGNFTDGYIFNDTNMIYDIKPKNLGIFLGKVIDIIPDRKLIKLKLSTPLSIGDGIETLDGKNSGIVTELLNDKKEHIRSANINDIIYVNLKGTNDIENEIYKTSSKELNKKIQETFNGKEYTKKDIDVKIEIKRDTNVKVYINNKFEYISDIIPSESINKPLTKESIITQFSKTNDTIYNINNFDIELEDNLFLPLSSLNNIRNFVLEKLYDYELNQIPRKKIDRNIYINEIRNTNQLVRNTNYKNMTYITINNLHPLINTLTNIDGIYIPYRLFNETNYDLINKLCLKYNVFIELPNIYKKDLNINFSKYTKIKGIVISNIGHLNLINDIKEKMPNIEIHANYSLNVFNNYTFEYLLDNGVNKVSISPELNEKEINSFNHLEHSIVECYGRIKCMTIGHCIVKDCSNCPNNTYKLIDRLNYTFPIITDNSNCTMNVYNSKILSYNINKFKNSNIHYTFTFETIEEIKNVIGLMKSNNNPQGDIYTNGNYTKNI